MPAAGQLLPFAVALSQSFKRQPCSENGTCARMILDDRSTALGEAFRKANYESPDVVPRSVVSIPLRIFSRHSIRRAFVAMPRSILSRNE